MIEQSILSQEHAELSQLAIRLLAVVSADRPAAAEASSIRWRLMRRFATHLAKEDQLLYPKLANSIDQTVAALASQFSEEMGGLLNAYRSYMTDWTSERMSADWQLFRTSTKAIMNKLAMRIEREEGELYPLLSETLETQGRITAQRFRPSA